MHRIRVAMVGVLVLAGSLAVPANGRQLQFQRTLGESPGDEPVWMEPTSDGGFVVLGGRAASVGAGVATRVLKLDSGGGIVWQREYSAASGGHLAPTHLIPVAAGGFAFTALDLADGIEVVSLDSAGNVVWDRRVGGSTGSGVGVASSHVIGPAIAEAAGAPSGGFVIAGAIDVGPFYWGVTPYMVSVPVLHRVASDGTLLWSKSYLNPSTAAQIVTCQGGSSAGVFNDVHALADGFIAVGLITIPSAPSSPCHFVEQTLVVRTDLDGNLLWAKTYRDAQHSAALGVDLASNGDFLVCGFAKDAREGGAAYLMRLDSLGGFIYQKWFLGFRACRALEELATGDIILGGTAGNDGASLLRTDSAGVFVWWWKYGLGNPIVDHGLAAAPLPGGRHAVLGRTISFGPAASNFYLIKTDPTGSSDCYETNPPPDLDEVGLVPEGQEFLEPIPALLPQRLPIVTDPEIEAHLLCMNCPGNDACPPGAVLEGEPASPSLPAPCDSPAGIPIPVSCGTTVCGEFWWDTVIPSTRDGDWYEFTNPGILRSLSISVEADVDVDLIVITPFCANPVLVAEGSGTCPTTATIECIGQVTYWVFVSPKFSNQPIAPGTPESMYVLHFGCGDCMPIGCPTDLNGDGVTDPDDLGTLLGIWGPTGGPSPADFNLDGQVDGDDLGTLLGGWGSCR